MTTTAPNKASSIDASQVLGRPRGFNGEQEWRDWRFAFETCFACLGAQAEEVFGTRGQLPDANRPGTELARGAGAWEVVALGNDPDVEV